jgi:mediator of RNA polymerase II transcription subunit 9
MTSISSNDVDMPTDTVVTVSDIDAEFLPAIHDIVKNIEKDPQDAATKNKEGLEASQKIQDLNKKIEVARGLVKKLPGIDFTKEEQAAQLKALKKQLLLKQELIQKYKKLGDASVFLSLTQNQNGLDSTQK